MTESMLTIKGFTTKMKIGIIAVLLILLCVVPSVATVEPFPGWKYRSVLDNSGLYNGGYRPNNHELWNVSDITQPAALVGIIESTPAVANGLVYVGDNNKHLFAIFANNGSIKWRNTLDDSVYSSPAVANGIVYVGTGDTTYNPRTFYAFDANTGGSNIPVWKKDATHGGILGGFESSPTVYNGIVYVGRDDYNVSAWNAATGADVWRFQTTDWVSSSPAVSGGRVYFSTGDSNLFAVDASTGAYVWDAQSASGWDGTFVDVGSSPAVANGVVYIGGEYAVYAFDAATGAQLPNKFSDDDAYFHGAPAVANGIVYIGTGAGPTDNVFYALDATDLSTVIWMNVTPDNTDIEDSPAVANGVVYVTTEDGYLYAWDAATGIPLWSFHTPDISQGTDSGPAVANGVVYFGTWGDGLYAVGTENTNPSQVGVFRPSNHMFYLKNGTKTTTQNWGVSTDLPVTGDWNGDGLADVGVFRNSTHIFYLKNGTKTTSFNWGLKMDLPVTGDWNGDGLADVGIFRNTTHTFYLKNGTKTTTVSWGINTDLPVTGDWNGDGLADVGVFRPSNHVFYLKNGTKTTSVNWGIATDLPVTGDWNGDGLADVGVFRNSTHIFYLKNGTKTDVVNWGINTDKPVIGKWS
jgi:outer membrane protein assembly factor BamB